MLQPGRKAINVALPMAQKQRRITLYTVTRTCTHAHAHTHACTHARTHAHTHTHTHTMD